MTETSHKSDAEIIAPKLVEKSRLRVFLDSDIFYAFRRSPVAGVSTVVVLILVLSAVFAPLIAPTNPFDPASLNLMNGFRTHATQRLHG